MSVKYHFYVLLDIADLYYIYKFSINMHIFDKNHYTCSYSLLLFPHLICKKKSALKWALNKVVISFYTDNWSEV